MFEGAKGLDERDGVCLMEFLAGSKARYILRGPIASFRSLERRLAEDEVFR